MTAALVFTWRYFEAAGTLFHALMLVFLAALQQIDRNLYEAAAVEGANRWQSFRYITVPLLRPTIIFILLMTTLWSFNAFDYVYDVPHAAAPAA